MEKLTYVAAKQLDLVDYLSSLGHLPTKINGSDYWYHSPLREEKTPSFKVNRNLNVWYDHGEGKGGNLIDFGTVYFKCTANEFLQQLAGQAIPSFPFHQPQKAANRNAAQRSFADGKKENAESKIVIVETRQLADKKLLDYLQKRSIPIDIASHFCREVDFLLYGRKHTVVGFQNGAGGYELRSENFKGSSSPKAVTLLAAKPSNDLAVFEGFFSFLSFQTINRNKASPLTNCLVLNSLSFFEKSRELMEGYRRVHLILDRDGAGTKATKKALGWNTGKQDKYIDRSDFYSGFKDVNEWLQSKQPELKQGQRIRRSF
ncbi:DNA primase [Flavobacterium zepuense]|uniref:DNA primase n=1 Tax=Flavobacterium zepuense TaxID=2593302 RepID=A0A552V001_9FLAO|nr:toprim domain-containing protein [Flavobacterium zepuense]TRW23803.1 DNA primase [Flavobacterium zepuense]